LTGFFVTHKNARRLRKVAFSQAGWRAGLSALLILGTAGVVKDATATNETRTLSFHHTHSLEDLTITFKRNGRYDEAALTKLNWFLRDWRSQEQHAMNPRLFDILWEVYRDVDGRKPINIISSYRSPGTNAMLRRRSRGVARHSQHMLGNAMDFFIPGVPLEKIRFAGLRLQRGGVGFYPTSGSPFVHLDTGNIRHWPRMNHDELVRVFPDGRTVHVPSDGVPLKGYQLARADISRRNELGDNTFRNNSRTFLAALFGRTKAAPEEADDDANTAPAKTPTTRAAPTILAGLSVPSPRSRPVQARAVTAKSYQVAALTSRNVILPDAPARAEPTRARMTNPADIINARGFWDEGVATQSDLPAVIASADPQSTASVGNRAGLDARTLARAKLAMAYAAADRAIPVARARLAANPMGHDARHHETHAAPMPARAAAPRAQLTAAWNPAKSISNDPWLRAMILAPSSQNYLSATQSGSGDMTTLASLMHKPRTAVYIAFAGSAHPDLTFTRFTGPAIAFLPTVSFGLQTAALR